MSLTSSLIQLIRNKSISDDDLVSAAMFTLDAVACAYAGSNTPAGEKLIAWAKYAGLDSKRQAFLMAALTHIT